MFRHEIAVEEPEPTAVIDAAVGLGLAIKEIGLKRPPGALHWHLAKLGSRGTLEITWLPEGKLIIEARANRFAEWQPSIAEKLLSSLS